MLAFIHKLRQKPVDVRNRIALFVAVSITLIIVSVWFVVLRSDGRDSTGRSAEEDLRPLMMIFGGAKEGWGEIRSTIKSEEQ